MNYNQFNNKFLLTTDSNKENTPSKLTNSNSKENNIKTLQDQSSVLMNASNMFDSENFKLLKEKEELSCIVMEKDSILFKEKAELEYLNDIKREKEFNRNKILDNTNTPHHWVENYFISNKIFTLEQYQNNIQILLKHDLIVRGSKQRDKVVFHKIAKTSPNSAAMNELLDREYNNETESTKYFAAYNII